MAKFNPVANRISVVWHELEQPGSSTADVYYISKSGSKWQPAKVRINDVQANDQFMPALDTDLTGNLIVTFYDRRNDPSNILYQVFSVRIDPNGNRLEPNQPVSTFQSDPRRTSDNFIGDYQDSWSQSYSGPYYYFPASVGIPPGAASADIYVSAINPVAEFFDVPSSYWAYSYIKADVTKGSMFGCGGGNFCPTALVDRKMMADYIIVAMHQIQSSAAYNAYFDDVANDAWAPFINRAYELGITSGCGFRVYCPNTFITRAQIAVFIIRGMNQTPSGAAYNAYFDDIADDGYAPYINRMYELGITSGCGFRLYCPNSNLPKDQMAVFLYRAFPN